METFITEENTDLLETKLVHIMDEFKLVGNKSLIIEKEGY